MALVVEQRGALLSNQRRLVQQRSAPAVFIVDADLRMLYHRADPGERRRDCRPEPGSTELPPAVARAARTILGEARIGDRESVTCAADASVVVRVLPLKGSSRQLFAVLVERLKIREHLQDVAARCALSQRERQVLRLLVQGAQNNEIAERLHIAQSTAVFHVKRIMAKIGARNRTELVAKVIG
jgi:DNA-binding CsgD family transcriptional regulator